LNFRFQTFLEVGTGSGVVALCSCWKGVTRFSEAGYVLQTLPRDQEIVAYCRGPYCMFSDEAVARLQGAQATELLRPRLLRCPPPTREFFTGARYVAVTRLAQACFPVSREASLPRSFGLLRSVGYGAFLRTLKPHVSCVLDPLVSVATTLTVCPPRESCLLW
jgi:hypothetical protein